MDLNIEFLSHPFHEISIGNQICSQRKNVKTIKRETFFNKIIIFFHKKNSNIERIYSFIEK
jgi:hypothetical protein